MRFVSPRLRLQSAWREKIVPRTFVYLVSILPFIGGAPAASTDPLGFYVVKVAGRPENGPPARTHMGIQLLPNIEFAGLATSVNGNTMSFGQQMGSITDPDQTLYLHVVNGPGQGFISDIAEFDGENVVCASALENWLSPGAQAIIRPHPHLSEIFGADNRFGLGAGPDAASADNIVIWDAETQQERVYYFHSERDRWEEQEIAADAGKALIRYPHGLYIVRRSAGNLRIALRGEIGFQPVLLPVRRGANVFSLPVNLSASVSNLITSEGPFSVIKAPNASRADLLVFEEPFSGAQKGPFYFRSTPVDSGWREVGVNDSEQPVQALDMLSTLTVRRRGEAGFVLAQGSLEPSPSGQLPVTPDPEPGELPLIMEFPLRQDIPSEIVFILEKSTDLQNWEPIPDLGRNATGIAFQVPPGESRFFYRATVTLAP